LLRCVSCSHRNLCPLSDGSRFIWKPRFSLKGASILITTAGERADLAKGSSVPPRETAPRPAEPPKLWRILTPAVGTQMDSVLRLFFDDESVPHFYRSITSATWRGQRPRARGGRPSGACPLGLVISASPGGSAPPADNISLPKMFRIEVRVAPGAMLKCPGTSERLTDEQQAFG